MRGSNEAEEIDMERKPAESSVQDSSGKVAKGRYPVHYS